MNLLKIGIGLSLFLSSAMIADLLAIAGWSITWAGVDYAPSFTAKILDTLAGSLIIWGILDIKPRKKKKVVRR